MNVADADAAVLAVVPSEPPTVFRVSAPEPHDPGGRLLWRVFCHLIEWRRLPGYRFEQRVDAFLIHFLPELLERLPRIGWGGVEFVAPELPVQSSGTQYVDAVLHRTLPRPAWILLEIKTDSRQAASDTSQWEDRCRWQGLPLHTLMKPLPEPQGQEKRYPLYKRRLTATGYSLDDPVEVAMLVPGSTAAFEAIGGTVVSFDELAEVNLDDNPEWMLLRHTLIAALKAEPNARVAGEAQLLEAL